MFWIILGILYVASLIVILIAEIWHLLSVFICRKKTTCYGRFCTRQSTCMKVRFSDDDIEKIQALIETFGSND